MRGGEGRGREGELRSKVRGEREGDGENVH